MYYIVILTVLYCLHVIVAYICSSANLYLFTYRMINFSIRGLVAYGAKRL